MACEHGVEGLTGLTGPWAGGIGKCDCCGNFIYYIDCFGSNGYGSWTASTWEPKNRCGQCGGKQVTHHSHVDPTWPKRSPNQKKKW
jgi:hypothetical protein